MDRDTEKFLSVLLGAFFDSLLRRFGEASPVSSPKAAAIKREQMEIAGSLRKAKKSLSYLQTGAKSLSAADECVDAGAVDLASIKGGRSSIRRCRRALVVAGRAQRKAARVLAPGTDRKGRKIESRRSLDEGDRWARMRVGYAGWRLKRAAAGVEDRPRYREE